MDAKSSMVNLLGKLNRLDPDYKDYLIIITTASGTYKAEYAFFFDDVIADIKHAHNNIEGYEYDADINIVEKVFSDADSSEINTIFEKEYNHDVVVLQNVQQSFAGEMITFNKQLLMFMSEIITITLEKKTVVD